jgi:hypothetical protein
MYIVQVAIPEVRTVKNKGLLNRTYTEYMIWIQVNLQEHFAWRRYKEFDQFFQMLKKKSYDMIPAIPPKKWGKLQAHLIATRQ